MLGSAEMVSMSAAEALAFYRAQKPNRRRGILKEAQSVLREDRAVRRRFLRAPEVVAVRKAARTLLPRPIRQLLKRQMRNSSRQGKSQTEPEKEKPLPPLIPFAIRFYAAKTSVRIDKAQRLLGYQPAFDLESGMALTERWARWANLL